MFKRIILIIVLIMVLLFESFAAVVSDNDGAAFITKAEFDSLKNDFQSKIDTYNTAIDSKIDNAIAGYIAGLNMAKRFDLQTNLDKDGKLKNGISLDWSSSTSKYFGDTSGERLAIESFTFYFEGTHKYGWASGAYQWNERVVGVPSVNERKYLTSKEVKIKLNDTTEVKSQTRMKVRCNIVWWWEEWQPEGQFASMDSWYPSSPQYLASSYTNVKQNTRELKISNTSPGYAYDTNIGPSWVGMGAITVETKDIADDNETYIYDELLCPLSTANEFVWDTTVNNQNVTQYGSTANRAWSTGNNLNWKRPSAIDWFNQKTFSGGGPMITDGWKVPWMKQERRVQDMYLTNLISIDNRHRQVKNGLIVCDTDRKGNYSFKVSATESGKFYAYIGSTPISNWTSADFTGKVFDITEANKSYTFEWENVTEEKTPIWICYLPTSTTNVGRLKVESVFYEAEQQ